jgi:hypothetical protein
MFDISAYKIIADIRPGMDQSQIARLLVDNDLPASPNEPGGTLPWRFTFSGRRLSALVLSGSFSREVPIVGIRIGFSEHQIAAAHPDAVMVPAPVTRDPDVRSWYIPVVEQHIDVIALVKAGRVGAMMILQFGSFERRWPEEVAMARRAASFDAEIARIEREEAAHAARERAAKRELANSWRSIADPDEMLATWARHALIWGEHSPRLLAYEAWLRAGGPQQWHDAAENWNWDMGTAPLRWIVSQPDCDRATALSIFYLGEPQDQPDEGDAAELLAMIRRRWAAEGFPANGIAYSLPRWIEVLPAERAVDKVPLTMRVSLSGNEVPTREYHDGIPVELGLN